MESVRTIIDDLRAYMSDHPILALMTCVFLVAYEFNIAQSLWRKVFVRMEVHFSKKLNVMLESKKRELFSPLLRMAASTERVERPLRVLEIGLGGGSNFDFYPDGTEIIGVDPNPEYLTHLNRELETKSGSKVTMTRIVCAGAETMDEFIERESVDAVVATLVLCTVQDVTAVVNNCWKVLKPGGVFLFLHHNRADPMLQPWKAWFQDLITPITYRIADGCHFNRNPIVDIQGADFSVVNFEKYSPTTLRSYHLVHPFLIGCAVK